MYGDELVTGLLNGTYADPDDTANDLLSQVAAGYPVDRLRPLLRTGRTEAVRVGMWVVSELGQRGVELIDDVADLLDHPSRYVRFFALDSVLTAADSRHPASGIRWCSPGRPT